MTCFSTLPFRRGRVPFVLFALLISKQYMKKLIETEAGIIRHVSVPLASVRHLKRLAMHPSGYFLVGEKAGKSTLLEASRRAVSTRRRIQERIQM